MILLAPVLLVAGVAVQANELPIPVDVQEVAFSSAIGAKNGELVSCLSTNGADTPSDVLMVLAKGRSDIVAASECVAVVDPNGSSYDRASGRKAYFVNVSGFHKIDANHVTVSVGLYNNGLNASNVTLFLEHSATGWVIQSRRFDSIS